MKHSLLLNNLRFRSTFHRVVLAGLVAGSAEAGTIVFSAPPQLRATLRKAIEAQGAQAIDASAIDDGLFNSKTCAKKAILGGKFTLAPVAMLPAEVKEDWRRGLAGCAARIKRDPGAAEACADEFAQAVWQRYLEHVQPERVIEVKPPEREDAAFAIEVATYLPADSGVSVLGKRGPKLELLVTEAVTRILTGPKLNANGVRPNSSLIPGDAPPPPPDLAQGTVQTLEPLKLPPGCRLPATIELSPAEAPLAKTIAALWSATARGHESKEPPSQCSLSISAPETGATSELTAHCGSSVTYADIFVGTRFAEPRFQAVFARNFLAQQLAAHCAPSEPKK